MARRGIIGPMTLPDSGVFQDRIGNQITAAASPSIGDELAYVLADGGTDEGWKSHFPMPKFTGALSIKVRGILDGAPGASDTLGFGFRKRAAADNESGDGTYDAEETVSVTIGSSGSGYADKDVFEMSITITAAQYAENDDVGYYFYIDASGTTYTGNVLIRSVSLDYTPG